MKRITTLVAGFTLVAVTTSTAQVLGRTPHTAQPEATMSTSAATFKNGKVRILSVQAVPTASKQVKGDYDSDQEVTLFEEDFAGMTTGSYEKPDTQTDLWYSHEECPFVWQNMKEGYTKVPKWGCENAHSAGGMVYMRADSKKYSFARLNTPMVNCADNDGVTYFQFDARTKSGVNVADIYLEFAETNNMNATWGNTGGGLIGKGATDTWTTYTVALEGTGPTTIFNLASSTDFNDGKPAGLFIDNVRIFQKVPNIARPVALPHSGYKGTSFTANWKAVDKAVSYNLSVYSINETQSKVYLLENQSVTGTSYEVTNTESGKTYYYTVTAIDAAGHESRPATDIMVFDIEAPTISATAINEQGAYTASWNAVPSADVYNYYAGYKNVIKENGPVKVVDEDLNNLTFDGAEALFDPVANPETFDEEYPGRYETWVIQEMKQAGWNAMQYTPCKGYIGIDGWLHISNPNELMGSLQSPELELGKNGGKFKLTLSLASEGEDMSDWTDEQGNPMFGIYYSRAAVALFNYDETVGDYVQVEMQTKDVTDQWEDYEFNFTKGTDRSLVGVFATRVPCMLFIDNIRLEQEAKAGDSYNTPFLFKRYHADGTSLEVSLPACTKDSEIWHKVCGVKSQKISDENVKITEGQWSKYAHVGTATHADIQTALQEKMFVTLEGNTVHVKNPAAEMVEVYSLDGKLVTADRSGNAHVTCVLPGNGVYIVKVGAKSVKLTF